MLSGDLKYYELIVRTYPNIKAHSKEIGNRTYMNMFAANAEIKELFKNTPPTQAQRLIDTVMLYCEIGQNFELLYGKLDNIAHVHINHHVKNEYYPEMKTAFIKALCDTLEIEESSELAQAWDFGFSRLSDELIHIENLIRKYSGEETHESERHANQSS
jgi:hemoglobin-like flavoprotein